ncbi:hypothetical protein [Pseudoduganella lutea]|uniref:Alpha/beta hydrolase n=1 Tax=Pseudoduganella lutea TaxID=321985 RepID=A0A4P6L432_9BURK|nr:hypothetical protein [Pseudoduganella lutea]QBE65608.1 hypothetical protein EWM63_23615 [Pseudoduganella lutea]
MPNLLRAMAMVVTLCAGCLSDRAYHNGLASTSATPVDTEMHGRYVLAHVEFDDQGWFHDARQRQALFETLHGLRARNQSMLIVTYTHGWKHNAGENDTNLRDFRKLLAELAAIERQRRPNDTRTVVGVYVGWRGASVSVPFVDNLTFWTRKAAAERIGQRSVKQLFFELNQFRTIANGWDIPDQLARDDETQLIFVGHSFGGLITYHALYAAILERGLQVDKLGRYRPAKSVGDFVLLVNPAFEGADYEPIWQAARSRGCFPPAQKPVMAIITSSADAATRVAFPLGRLYTYLQSAPLPGERETVLHTVGHLDRYRTHRLVDLPVGETGTAPDAAAPPNVEPVTKILDLQLVKTDNAVPARMPYLVIQAGPGLIADHSDFWNERFRKFSVRFITTQILSLKIRGEAARARPAGPQRDDCPGFIGNVPG